MVMRCSNTECESHDEERHAFSVNIVFDDDRKPIENPQKIPPEYFECVYCGSRAEDVT